MSEGRILTSDEQLAMDTIRKSFLKSADTPRGRTDCPPSDLYAANNPISPNNSIIRHDAESFNKQSAANTPRSEKPIELTCVFPHETEQALRACLEALPEELLPYKAQNGEFERITLWRQQMKRCDWDREYPHRATLDEITRFREIQEYCSKNLNKVGKCVQIHNNQKIGCRNRKCNGVLKINDAAIKTTVMMGTNSVEEFWHPGCFKCEGCGQFCADLIFSYYRGRYLCAKDFMSQICERCAQCDEPILSDNLVCIGDNSYHPHCFKCKKCDTQLAGKYFFYVKGEKHCDNCYTKIKINVEMKCAKCKKQLDILDNVYMIKNFLWHQKCLECTRCEKLPENKSDVVLDPDSSSFKCYERNCH